MGFFCLGIYFEKELQEQVGGTDIFVGGAKNTGQGRVFLINELNHAPFIIRGSSPSTHTKRCALIQKAIIIFFCTNNFMSEKNFIIRSSYIFSTYIGFFFIHQKTCFFIEFICLFFSRNQSNSELAKKCYYTQKDNQT